MPGLQIAARPRTGVCAGCGRCYASTDGILDFVGGRFDTQLDVTAYDDYHGIDDGTAERAYRQMRHLAGDRWPDSLGSVVEIGCGTGLFSRAMIAHGDAADAVLTDVSPDMLRLCRAHLERLGLGSALPLRFATYSANEACFRDAAFDACIGTSVVHHIADVRGFLADVWRMLKPGGCACFTEPGFRYTRVMGMALAEIIALLLVREPDYGADRQTLHNWVAEARRGTMLQGDPALLADLEDKHMFIGEAFEALALDVGFATAEALNTVEADGLGNLGGLLARIGVGEPVAGQIMRLWPSYAGRYLALLHTTDLASGYLFWLTKPRTPIRPPRSSSPVVAREPRRSSEDAVTGGGMPFRWVLSATAEPAAGGLRVHLRGWCLANADIKVVRLTIDGMSRAAPVWFPRADVHQVVNPHGQYAAWNSLCCGVDAALLFDGLQLAGRQRLALDLDFVFSDDRYVPIVAGGTLVIGEEFSTGR